MNDGAVAQSIVLPHRNPKSLLTGWIASSSRNEAARAPLSLGDFVRALRHRWLLFALIALASTILVTTISFALPSRYTGEAVLRIEPNPRSTAQIGENINRPPDEALIETEVNLIRSRSVLARVIDGLEEAEVASLVGNNVDMPSSELRPAAVNALGEAIEVEREGTTYLVSIAVTLPDPELAARLANAVAASYLDLRHSASASTGGDQLENIEAQMAEVRSGLEGAERAAAEFRASRGIVSDDASGTITQQQIAPISMQLATAEAQAAEAAARLASARREIAAGGIEALSENMRSDVVTELQRQRADIMRERGEIVTRYGPNHPSMIEANQQLADIDTQLRAEATRIENNLAANARSTAASAASLRGKLNELRARQARDARQSVTAESLEREALAQREAYQELTQAAQYARQLQQGAIPAGSIVQNAVVPDDPSFPNRPLFAVLGALVGGLLGAGVVGVREMSGQTLISPDDVADRVGIGCGGVLPPVTSRQRRKAGSGANLWDYVIARPTSQYAESLRQIRRAIRADLRGKTGIYAITSAVPGEGKTTLTVSLGRIAALAGDEVLVIDCDLRRRSLSRQLGLTSPHSLSDVIYGRASLTEAILTDTASGLDVLPASEVDNGGKDILGSAAMAQLLARLRGQFDMILLDTPPLLALADARTVAAMADGTILSIEADSTPAPTARAAVSRLQADGIGNLGAILTFRKAGKAARAAMGQDYGKYDDYFSD